MGVGVCVCARNFSLGKTFKNPKFHTEALKADLKQFSKHFLVSLVLNNILLCEKALQIVFVVLSVSFISL